MKRLALFIASLSLLLSVAMPSIGFAAPSLNIVAGTVACNSAAKCSACAGLAQLNSNSGCTSNSSPINNLVATVVNILSWVVGIIAVIMIMISGLKFATAGGESNKVSEAKTALIWALAGLFVAALAQALVHWVLATAHGIALIY